ncbi:hypothetical protein M728_002234 [Ensifer sp. WSM1721]
MNFFMGFLSYAWAGSAPVFMMNKLYTAQTEWSLNEKTRQTCRASKAMYRQRAALADDLQVDCLRSLAAAIRLGVEGDLLVFRETAQAGGLHGRNMYEDVRATAFRFDEAKALVGVKEFYSASFGHASGPFLSARFTGGIAILPNMGVGAGSSRQLRKGSWLSRPAWKWLAKISLPTLVARSCLRLRPAYFQGLPAFANCPNRVRVMGLFSIGKQNFSDGILRLAIAQKHANCRLTRHVDECVASY